jgi:hypothetical protein
LREIPKWRNVRIAAYLPVLTALAVISIEVPGLGVSFFAIPDAMPYARYTRCNVVEYGGHHDNAFPRTLARP